MFITFVRHGESVNNSQHRHHDTDCGLTELGKLQATQLKSLLALASHDALFTSPLLRAQQTAQIVHHTPKAIVLDSRLQEVRKPSRLNQLKEHDEEYLAIKQALLMHGHKKDWHHSDEESFYDFHARIKNFLMSVTHTNALVITHSGVMRMVLAIVNNPDHSEESVIKSYLDSRRTVAIENGTAIKLERTGNLIQLAEVKILFELKVES